jgi:transcription antitermination protein NusB
VSRNRRAARELALDVLYQAEIRDQLPLEALALQERQGWFLGRDEIDHEEGAPADEVVRYARALVEGVQTHAAAIDAQIARFAQHWALDRMPVVDRNLLRAAVFELLWMPDVPTAVVINEAIELAKSHSTEDSGRFINGILGRVADEVGSPYRQKGDG